MPLPSPRWAGSACASGVTFAVAGDPWPASCVGALGGRLVEVDDEHRAAYHAAACIAANHLVALMGQVERVAAAGRARPRRLLPLARAAVDDVAELGPAAALTGPAARGDEATLGRHRAALPEDELPGYQAGVALAPPGPRPTPPAVATGRRRPSATAPVVPAAIEGHGRRGGHRDRAGFRDALDGGARPGPHASASSPPWVRCTPGTARWSRGRRPSATWWPSPSS